MRGIRKDANKRISFREPCKVVKTGGKDISISLDSLNGLLQDKLMVASKNLGIKQ